jgi:hypothetical protein
MAAEIEARRVEARDEFGNRHVIIFERNLGPVSGSEPSTGTWRFRLEDGRIVSPGAKHGFYFIEEGHIPLTTDDPNEPKD